MSTASNHRHPPSPPRRSGRKNITKRTFRAATIVVQVNKNDYYFSPLNFEFEYFFFCGLLSLRHNTLVLWYTYRTQLKKKGWTHNQRSSLNPSHRNAIVGWQTRNYLQQLCTDTRCSLEDLPETIDDRDEWPEWDKENRTSRITW